MTKECRKIGRDIAMLIRGNLSSPFSQTSSTRKVLKKIAKRCAAMAVFIGRDTKEILWSCISYIIDNAPLVIHKRKMILEILPVHHLQGFKLNLGHADEPEFEEAVSDVARDDDIGGLKDSNSSPNHKQNAILLNSISLIRRELAEPSLGWPLLRRKSPSNQEFKKAEARDMSVVEWVMRRPNRVTTVVNQTVLHTNQTSNDSKTNTTHDSTIKDRKTEEVIPSPEVESIINGNRSSKDESYGVEYNAEVPVSLNKKDLESYSKPGWPLLRITAYTT